MWVIMADNKVGGNIDWVKTNYILQKEANKVASMNIADSPLTWAYLYF